MSADAAIFEIQHKRQQSHDSGTYQDWPHDDIRSGPENHEFVTVVAVENSDEARDKNFVTVLSIELVEEAEPEDVLVYRLPGERLGFGLKFEGGVKTVEKVGKLFIQSCAVDSPASRTSASWGPLSPGDEIIAIDGVLVSDMTRIDCVRALKESNVVIKLRVRQGKQNLKSETKASQPQQDALAPPIPPRKFPRKKESIELPQGFDDRKASPPVMPRSRYIVPQAEVYTDLISQECHVPTESESDDTGSSISTVVSRISSAPTTSNSSFSDGRSINSMDITSPPSPTSKNTPFDLDKVLEPFLQLEREFSSSAIEDGSIFSKLVEASNLLDQKDDSTLKPPENFQDDEENQPAATLTAHAPELPPKPCPRQELDKSKWKNSKRRPPPPPPPQQRSDRPVCPDPHGRDVVSSHLPRLIDFVPKDRTDFVIPNPHQPEKDVDEEDGGMALVSDSNHAETESKEQNEAIPVPERAPLVTDMEENLNVASQPLNCELPDKTSSCETSLLPPSFSRLPPDGHEFPVHYEETCIKDDPPLSESSCKLQCTASVRSKEPVKRASSLLSPTETVNSTAATTSNSGGYFKHGMWRNDEKSEKSVRDKIAMFSTVGTQKTAASPPILIKKMHKFKSSDDVSSRISHSEQVKATSVKQPVPVLPFHSLLDVSRDFDGKSLSRKTSSRTQSTTDLSATCFETERKVEYSTLPRKSEQKPSNLEMMNGSETPSLTRAVSFSGNTKLHSRSQSLVDVGSKSHFFHSKSTEEARRSSLNHLIEQRKKSMSKLRGLVIPEKVIENPAPQCVVDLPEIKSKDCLITNLPAVKPDVASPSDNESINNKQINKSVPVMPVPPWKADNSCDLPKYSPAFKRKSLALYSGTSTTGSAVSSVASSLSSSREELRSCFSEGSRPGHTVNRVNLSSRSTVSPSQSHSEPKSLESITSPISSDFSFEFTNNSVSPQMKNNNEMSPKFTKGTETKVNSEGRVIEEESDNDSAVSSSRSSESHGYSPPHSPVHGFVKLDNNSNCLNYSGNGLLLKRTLSSETTASTSSNGSTLTSGSQASCSSMSTTSSVESKRVLKPQSVEAINRKNVLSSAKFSSGLDLKTGYPLAKSSVEEKTLNDDQCHNSKASLKSVSPITVIENEVVDPEENSIEEPSIEQNPWTKTNGDTPNSPIEDFSCEDKIDGVDSLSPVDALSPSANDGESLEFTPIDSGDKKDFINSSPKSYVKDWRNKEIPSRNRTAVENGNKNYDLSKTFKATPNKTVNVNNIKKVFEKVDNVNGSNGRLKNSVSNININVQHPRVSSIDSTTSDDSYVPTQNTPYGSVTNLQKEQQFGSITSLASSTSLISQQELSQLIEEANHTLEDGGNSHEVVVVILHRDTPGGSIGITLAGGADYEAKEITVHKVLVGSPAERDGRIQKGDRILSINGKSMKGLTHYESLAILKAPRPEVVLVVSRHKVETPEESMPRTFGNMRTTRISESKYSSLSTEKGPETKWGPVVTVVLTKDGAGLGFSLDGGKDSPFGDQPLTVKKIFTGGCAEKCGQLFAGDELISVNNIDLSELSRIEAWALMKRLPDGKVHLNIRHPVH